MMGIRKITLAVTIGVAGLAAPLSAATATLASASTTTGTGAYECGGFGGTITFSPAWSDSARGKVKATLSFSPLGFPPYFATCGPSSFDPAPSPVPLTVSGKGVLKFANGTCSSSTSTPPSVMGKLKLTYNSVPKLKPSTMAFQGDVGSQGVLDSSGGTSVSGSYPSAPLPIVPIAKFDTWVATGNCTTGISAVSFSGGYLWSI